jgi:hypothetical protein
MNKEATQKCKGLKLKTSVEKRGNPRMHKAQIEDLRWKKRQPRNASGSNWIPPMKKIATPKCKGLKSKTFDEKRGNPKTKGLKSKTYDEKSGNPKMQGAQFKDLWWKKRQPQNARGSNQKPPMQKEATSMRKGTKNQEPLAHRCKLRQTNAWRWGWRFSVSLNKPIMVNRMRATP